LIAGAAAPDFSVGDFSGEGIVLPFLFVAEADGVDVCVDGDQARAGADLDEEVADAVNPDLVGEAELFDLLPMRAMTLSSWPERDWMATISRRKSTIGCS